MGRDALNPCKQCGAERVRWGSRPRWVCPKCSNARSKQSKERRPHAYLWSKAKYRAAQLGVEFKLEQVDIVIPAVCPVLGIPLEHGEGKATANSPTLDRRDSTRGYVRGNVSVISWRANRLKSDATSAELKALAKFFKTH